MRKTAIIIGSPTEEKVEFYNYLCRECPTCDFYILYTEKGACTYKRDPNEAENMRTVFLKYLFQKKRVKKKFAKPKFEKSVQSALSSFMPDTIVIDGFDKCALIALKYAKQNKIPYIYQSDISKRSEDELGDKELKAEALLLSSASAFIAKSTKAKERLESLGIDSKKVFLSPYTIDTKKYIKAKEKYNNRIVCYANESKNGGLDLLFAALSKVTYPYLLDVIGANDLTPELDKLCSECGVTPFINTVAENELDLYIERVRKDDIFVYPTRGDRFGLAAMSALCSSLPIIISNLADGASDVVRENENGFRIDPNDTDDFASKLNLLLTSREKREAMGRRSFEIAHVQGLKPSTRQFIYAINFAFAQNK